MIEGMTCCRTAQAAAKVVMVRCPDCDQVYESVNGLWVWIPQGTYRAEHFRVYETTTALLSELASSLSWGMRWLLPVTVAITGFFARVEGWFVQE